MDVGADGRASTGVHDETSHILEMAISPYFMYIGINIHKVR